MTDKQYYQSFMKFMGEKELLMAKDMIHTAGINTAYQNLCTVYEQRGKMLPEEFKHGMYRMLVYVSEIMNENQN